MSAVARKPVGARYGIGDWLLQRLTAVVMLGYTVGLLVVIAAFRPVGHAGWKAMWQSGLLRVATLVFFLALAYHAWVGMRDIVMDYVKPAWLRLVLESATVLALLAYVAWAVAILWGR